VVRAAGAGRRGRQLSDIKFDISPFLAVSWHDCGSKVQFQMLAVRSAFMTAVLDRGSSWPLRVNGPYSGIFPSGLIGNAAVVHRVVRLRRVGGPQVASGPPRASPRPPMAAPVR
jgi:hypothetical protein